MFFQKKIQKTVSFKKIFLYLRRIIEQQVRENMQFTPFVYSLRVFTRSIPASVLAWDNFVLIEKTIFIFLITALTNSIV